MIFKFYFLFYFICFISCKNNGSQVSKFDWARNKDVVIIPFEIQDLVQQYPHYFERIEQIRDSPLYKRQAIHTGWLAQSPQVQTVFLDCFKHHDCEELLLSCRTIRENPFGPVSAFFDKEIFKIEHTCAQAGLKHYNLMVMTKMFLLRYGAKLNPHRTQYHMFVDAGHLCGPILRNTATNLLRKMMGKMMVTYFDYGAGLHGESHGMAQKVSLASQ
jgi:hypothetical protein